MSQEVKLCEACGKEIRMMCMIGTGVCSELCRKFNNKEITVSEFVLRRCVKKPSPTV